MAEPVFVKRQFVEIARGSPLQVGDVIEVQKSNCKCQGQLLESKEQHEQAW
jgi:hypothetical protein